MKVILVFFPIMLFAILFESTIISFPLFFLTAAVLFLLKKDLVSGILILLMSLVFDALIMAHAGYTGLFLFCLFFLISLLENVFAVEGLWLSIILSVIGLEVYRYSMSYPFSPVLFSVLVVGSFAFMYMAYQKHLQQKQI
ncbi:MAG: hypothetical protein ACM3IJ_05130 [Candidatus Levyibacteriota bacterium]